MHFFQRNNFGLVFKNTIFLAFSEIFLKFIGVIWVVFLAHSLSVEEYGKYNLVNSFIGIFAFLPDLGIGLIVIREIAKNKKKATIYLGNSLVINQLFALITVLIVFVVRGLVIPDKDTDFLIFVASLTLFFSIARTAPIFFFEGTERMGVAAILNSVNTILLLLCAFILFNLGLGLPGIFWGMLVGTILSVIVSWISLARYDLPKVEFDKKLAKYFIFEGLPLGMAAFASLVYTNIDSVILGRMLGDKSVGIFNAASPFAFSLIQLLNVPFVMAVYPALSRIGIEDKRRFRNAVYKSCIAIGFWSFPTTIFISIFSPVIIPLIFGAKYDMAIPILRILIFFVPFLSLSALLYKVLIILGKQKIYLYISVLGALLNILLNIIFILKFQILGAVYATIATQVVIFLCFFSFVLYFINKKS